MKQSRCISFAWAALALAFPMSALADLSDTKTLSANTGLNLDTGAFTSSGSGDILWNGNTLTPQGNAKAANFGAVGSLTGLSKSILDGFKLLSSPAAIPSSTLVVGDVFVVFTNGGNTSGVLVTANSGSSITLQFTTFGVAGGSNGPTITNVLNNSSEIPAGFPNSGIAQGSLFKVLGSGLADSGDANLHQSDAPGGLPTTLNGASISISVNGVTKVPSLYYSTPTQIDGVMPSDTPTGSGTLTVAYKGVASNTFNILVVAVAPGITTYNNGTGVAQDVSRLGDPLAGLVTFTKSAAPGAGIILWGTGLGATADSDTKFTDSPHQTTIPYTIYIGGVQASIGYAGRSVYPGVGVLGVTIPANVPTGCYVPITAVANGTIVSNSVTLPIHAGGGACSDPQLGYDGNQLSTLSSGSTVRNGVLNISQATAPGTGTVSAAVAIFQKVTGIPSVGSAPVSIGGCILLQSVTGSSTPTITGLNAGTITVTPPGGSPVTLSALPQVAGFYLSTLGSVPSSGGSFAFSGSGGSDVGSFQTTVNFPGPLLNWTNQTTAASVARGQGLNITWTGGFPGTYVFINGSSVSGTASGSYSCIAPSQDGHFTVPSYILLGLPAGTGTTQVGNSTNITPFSATGLDFAGTLGTVSLSVNSTFN